MTNEANKEGAPRRLEAAAATFRQRNALYGDNWLHFGVAMKGIFPDGLRCDTVDDWNRLGIIVQCVAKLTRYGIQFAAGGHLDSAHDMCVYAAMLEELTDRSVKGHALDELLDEAAATEHVDLGLRT